MPKSEREEVLSALASRILSAMLDDIVMDVALQSHHEVSRSEVVCNVCNTNCSMAHVPGPSNFVTAAPLSRPPSPPLEVKAANGSLGTGTSTPTSVKTDGNIYFECLNCSRPIASSRYAPHLSSCMGLGRRGVARVANVKTKNSSESGRSPSPSDFGNASDDSRNPKGKGKSKSKRADEAEFNLKRKRPGSPQSSPNKKQKNVKIPGCAVTRVKSDGGTSSNLHPPPPITGSQSKVPSKLRDSSTASFMDRDRERSSTSRESSPAPSMSTQSSSGFSVHSPAFAGGLAREKKKKGRPAIGTGPPKRPSPPRPPPPPIQPPEPDYNVDVEGTNETGSDTDIESS